MSVVNVHLLRDEVNRLREANRLLRVENTSLRDATIAAREGPLAGAAIAVAVARGKVERGEACGPDLVVPLIMALDRLTDTEWTRREDARQGVTGWADIVDVRADRDAGGAHDG